MKHPNRIFCLIASMFLAVSASVAQVPESARWALHFDADALKRSTLGEALAASEPSPKAAAGLAWMGAALNFDPREDVDSVIMYGDGQPERAVTRIDGRFDVGKISAFLKKKSEAPAQTLEGLDVYTCEGKKGRPALIAFPNAETALLAPDEAAMIEAIQAYRGVIATTPFQKNPEAIVAGFAMTEEIARVNPRAAHLAAIRYLDFVATADGGGLNVNAILDAETAQSAADLLQLLNGLVSWARLKNRESAEMLAWINESVRLTREEATVRLNLDLPTEFVMSRIEKWRDR